MPLADEVREQLKTFAEGNLGPHELAGWLDSVAPELHAPGEEHLRRVVGQVYVLLAELGYGDRTAACTRHEVQKLLDQTATPKNHDAGRPDTIIPGATPRPS